MRILIGIWRLGDIQQYAGVITSTGSSSQAVSSDYDPVIAGIEECLVRHENALRELGDLAREEDGTVESDVRVSQAGE